MATGPEADTSLTLMERLRRDPADPRAWEEFVRRYRPMIRAWCLRWGMQDSDADDMTQDVLVKLLGAFRRFQYDPSRSFRAWLKTVARHALSDFLADRRDEPKSLPGPVGAIAASGDARADLERQLEEAFRRELLELAMRRVEGRVKPKTWEAFRLTAIDGLPGAEAARRLQVPVATVFVSRHRVQKMIQEEIRVLRPEET
jgi:RNA polymerase sigma-70 factor (ECF subfamily)